MNDWDITANVMTGEKGVYSVTLELEPGTYTFKRVMDFTDPTAFNCDYFVYDASGKALKQVDNVPTPVFNMEMR